MPFGAQPRSSLLPCTDRRAAILGPARGIMLANRLDDRLDETGLQHAQWVAIGEQRSAVQRASCHLYAAGRANHRDRVDRIARDPVAADGQRQHRPSHCRGQPQRDGDVARRGVAVDPVEVVERRAADSPGRRGKPVAGGKEQAGDRHRRWPADATGSTRDRCCVPVIPIILRYGSDRRIAAVLNAGTPGQSTVKSMH
ncbi:hypothetical protein [Sphingomonas sp. Leaf25]|uniref:hypothetical protein n=1 Tax=Sphingomonas sp. Leaf25 TaxID=1735692 RepID=UPI0012E1DF0D|nr:hypothetical protein [Sphingomonas sp. Leaf25]